MMQAAQAMAAGDESARSEIETLDGVGKALVDALISFFAVAENCAAVTGLIEAGVKPMPPEAVPRIRRLPEKPLSLPARWKK